MFGIKIRTNGQPTFEVLIFPLISMVMMANQNDNSRASISVDRKCNKLSEDNNSRASISLDRKCNKLSEDNEN